MSGKATGKPDGTDWERLKAMKDEEIDCSDIPETDRDFWKDAVVVMPRKKARLTARVDADVLDWFRAQGKGYQTRINAVLKAYVKAHQKSA